MNWSFPTVSGTVCYARKTGNSGNEDVNRVIADLEIIEIVRKNLTDDYLLEMNNLNKIYNNLIKNDYEINYKRYLKKNFK